jgi:hypothetical protein
MTDLNAIIEKLMTAEEGGRDLDVAVARSVYPDRKIRHNFDWFYWGVEQQETVPHYTTSLDAAVTLVPDGLDFYLEIEAVHMGPCCYAGVRPGGAISPAGNGWAGWGQKHRPDWPSAKRALPLALCIAALQARARAA